MEKVRRIGLTLAPAPSCDANTDSPRPLRAVLS